MASMRNQCLPGSHFSNAASLRSATISLVRMLATKDHAESFNLSVANSDGAVIQEMDSSTARDNGFADMSDLFYRARRHAVDLNGALDDILKELDELSSEKS